MRKPSIMASTKGGHCLTVRISLPWNSENSVIFIARSQSGRPRRAGSGFGRTAWSAGSQRKTIFIGPITPSLGLACRRESADEKNGRCRRHRPTRHGRKMIRLADAAFLPGLQQLVVGHRLALGVLVDLGPGSVGVGQPLLRVLLGVELGRAILHAGALEPGQDL